VSEPVVKLESFGRGEHDRSFTFAGYQRAITARTPEEVGSAILEAEAVTKQGLHAAGFVSYEAASGLDSALCVREPVSDVPLVWFGVFDTREVIEPEAQADIPFDGHLEWAAALGHEEYGRDISAIRDLIQAGDSYQVNHTFQMSTEFDADAWVYYRALCRSQKADYCAYIDTGRHHILSASPELFFRLQDGVLKTRPMKGTCRRGRWPDEDQALATQLRDSEKNRAENLMIVDLLRNDLGRVSETGSVKVSDLWKVEPYETLFQMTSTVESRIRHDVGLLDLFTALFPCGSVTGAPKIRTMEIIADVESQARGVYTGAVGYVSPGLDALFNVAIRTVTVDSNQQRAHFGVGGGITWDSTSEDEYQECLTKAKVLSERRPVFSLFETMRFDQDSGITLRDRHLRRLERSADYFGFRWDVDQVTEELDRAVEGCADNTRIRLTLRPDGGLFHEVGELSPQETYTVRVSPVRVDSSNVFLYHKTTYRDDYDRCRASCPDVDDVILVNERGELTEFTIGNLVFEVAGRRLTPPVSSGLLAGTFREELLTRGEIEESVLFTDDLRRASNVFMLNSVREWVPVTVLSPSVGSEEDYQPTLSAGS
jgi:para-aminobenzoate synthetase/4-amino-4-deoxychorismate lyase